MAATLEDPAADLEIGEPGELVVGIVAPVGADANKVRLAVCEVLAEFGYETTIHKLSARFSDPRFVAATGCSPRNDSECDRIRTAMDAGDLLRRNTGLKEILGIVAAGSIADERNKRQQQPALDAPAGSPKGDPPPPQDQEHGGDTNADQGGRTGPDSSADAEDATRSNSSADKSQHALDRVAHIIHSLKRPEEALYLSRVYGGRFLLLSIFAPREERLRNLMHRGMSEPEAVALVVRDESGEGSALPPEQQDFGQATRDTFHRADMFVDATRSDTDIRAELRRFFDLVFGSPLVTPRKHEHAMFLAFAASLKSGDLSRQVGAVLATETGIVVAEGANDAPGPFGVPYWPGETDHRDIAEGSDSNERIKLQMLAKLREEMARVAAALRPQDSDKEGEAEPNSLQEARRILEEMLSGSEFRQTLKRAGFLHITEFGRAVHAEMAALMSCASRGAPTRGLTLFCTTFPCHNCTKHLVAAGVARVVFIEPYPKSRAVELHSDAISLAKEHGKVEFSPFVGIGPKRYVDLFVLRDTAGGGVDRKGPDGKVISWSRRGQRPVVSDRIFTYIEREKWALRLMNVKIPKT